MRRFIGVGILFVAGCATSSGEESASDTSAFSTASDHSSDSWADEDVWIVAGDNKDKLLGCVTCASNSSDSVLNKFGKYGDKFGMDTIWNAYGNYGSNDASTSPWASYSRYPPKLYSKDRSKYFGKFTSGYDRERTHLSEATAILDKGRDQR